MSKKPGRHRAVFSRFRQQVLLPGCCATVMMSGCRSLPPQAPSAATGSDGMPIVRTPDIKSIPAPPLQPGLLPPDLQGSRITVSNLNLQRVSVALEPRPTDAQTPREVFDQVIVPFLQTVGFTRGSDAFQLPAEAVAEPPANLAGAAQLLVEQYRGVPERMRSGTEMMISLALGTSSELADSQLYFLTEQSAMQFRADFERVEMTYPFAQLIDGVPIEHTALVARRRRGESVSQVTGTLLHDYSPTNQRPGVDDDVRPLLRRGLRRIPGAANARMMSGERSQVLVALPYGNAANGGVALRYAWRLKVQADVARRPATFLAWIDAQTGEVLKLEPLSAKAEEARGNTWRRDAGTPTLRRSFEVSAADNGSYVLQLDRVSERVDYNGDEDPQNDVSILPTGTSTPPADFDQPPHNAEANANCGGNPAFPQITFFAWLQSSHKQAVHNGIYTPFPKEPWKPKVEPNFCEANDNLFFGACQGYFADECPNRFAGSRREHSYLSYAQDGTIVAHEVGHLAVKRLTVDRPEDWCGRPTCPKPVGWLALHELADAWADHLQDTNCVGGWVAKNVTDTDSNKNCVGTNPEVSSDGLHSEDSELPRRHELGLVLQPQTPRDHFPERIRSHVVNSMEREYASMQIASAALWQLREGMASRLPVLGGLRYFQRLVAALRATGLSVEAPATTDEGIYSYLYDLQSELLKRWAPAGSTGDRTTNEVLAAFARAGLFVLPPECLDGNSATTVSAFCPDGENGADAVIDIDDSNLKDDLVIEAVHHPESDFLQLGGPAPTFHVWTGSRFTFRDGVANLDEPACNAELRVEASTNENFAPGPATADSGWRPVDADAAQPSDKTCQGAWTPSEADWVKLQALGNGSKIYYRAQTRDSAGGNLRSSTAPGNGHWSVAAPFAVVSESGVPGM